MITKVKRIIIELSREEGEVVPIVQLIRHAKSRGHDEKDVRAALQELIKQGIVVRLDKDSVQLTAT